MKSLVVYESMYGNTHRIADIVGAVLSAAGPTDVLSTPAARPELVNEADLVVVGGPTHVHNMSSRRTRAQAAEMAAADAEALGVAPPPMDPSWDGPGLREWFRDLPVAPEPIAAAAGQFGAAFDTRINAHALLTGRASKAIARRMSRHGFVLVTEPQSFLVDKTHGLLAQEAEHARHWAQSILTIITTEKAAPLEWMDQT